MVIDSKQAVTTFLPHIFAVCGYLRFFCSFSVVFLLLFLILQQQNRILSTKTDNYAFFCGYLRFFCGYLRFLGWSYFIVPITSIQLHAVFLVMFTSHYHLHIYSLMHPMYPLAVTTFFVVCVMQFFVFVHIFWHHIQAVSYAL